MMTSYTFLTLQLNQVTMIIYDYIENIFRRILECE